MSIYSKRGVKYCLAETESFRWFLTFSLRALSFPPTDITLLENIFQSPTYTGYAHSASGNEKRQGTSEAFQTDCFVFPARKGICPSHLSLEFCVYLVNNQTGKQTQEVRTLRFWFRHVVEVNAEHASIAQEFFGDLIHPKEFPRDYVGFVKKIMKLLQHKFYGIVRIELVLQQIEDSELLHRPCSCKW